MDLNFLLPEMIIYVASCMSLIRYHGIRQVKPFAAICSNILQQDMLVEKSKIFSDNRKRSLKMTENSLRRHLDETKDDILFVQYTDSKNMKEYLNQICDALSEGYCESEAINCVICVLFNGYIPSEVTDSFSIIIPNKEVEEFLQSDIYGRNMASIFMSSKENINLLSTMLHYRNHEKFDMGVLNEDEELLYVAAMTKCILHNNARLMLEFREIVREKISLSLDSRDRSDLPELFVDMLYKEVTELCPMINYVDARNNEKMDKQCILYNDFFYYVPERVMDSILRSVC